MPKLQSGLWEGHSTQTDLLGLLSNIYDAVTIGQVMLFALMPDGHEHLVIQWTMASHGDLWFWPLRSVDWSIKWWYMLAGHGMVRDGRRPRGDCKSACNHLKRWLVLDSHFGAWADILTCRSNGWFVASPTLTKSILNLLSGHSNHQSCDGCYFGQSFQGRGEFQD